MQAFSSVNFHFSQYEHNPFTAVGIAVAFECILKDKNFKHIVVIDSFVWLDFWLGLEIYFRLINKWLSKWNVKVQIVST